MFRCSLSDVGSGRWLELPMWMFDRAACLPMRIMASPRVHGAALATLKALLRETASAASRTQPSRALVSGAGRRSVPPESERCRCEASASFPGITSGKPRSSICSGLEEPEPQWRQLPQETRSTVTDLMARLLSEHRRPESHVALGEWHDD